MQGPCGGIEGAWHTGLVNVGYYPFTVLHGRTPMRYGPAHDAPIILLLARTARFGAQSTRNPGHNNHPPMRPSVNGFVWGYSYAKGRSGWIEYAALTTYDGTEAWANGPAHADFQVGAQPSKPHGRNSSCAGQPGTNHRQVAAQDVYLRYAPHSTPFWYLEAGDTVQERWRNNRHDVCVQVIASNLCPPGTIGWLPYYSLSRKKLPPW